MRRAVSDFAIEQLFGLATLIKRGTNECQSQISGLAMLGEVMTKRLARSQYRNTNQGPSIIRQAMKRPQPMPIRTSPLKMEGDQGFDLTDLIKELDQAPEEYLDGKAVSAVRSNVDVSTLDFWLDNPRLFKVCSTRPESQEEVIEALAEKEHDLPELTIKILNNGGLADGLTVVKEGNRYKVLEGNCRTFISKMLNKQIPIPESWPKKVREEIAKRIEETPFPKTAPIVIYKNLSARQLQARLAIDHISGKKQWSPLQKAHFAFSLLKERSTMDLEFQEVADLRKLWHELSHVDQETLKDVAKVCGFNSDKMNELRYRLMAYAANAIFCRTYEEVANQRNKFDVFRRFYSQKWWRDMAEPKQPYLWNEESKKDDPIMYPDPEIEGKFMDWLAAGRIGETLHMDSLHKVIHNEVTREIFLSEGSGYKEAFKKLQEIESPDEITSDMVFNTAHAYLRSLNPKALKNKANEKVRTSLHQLKAEIAVLEATLGEAV